MSGTTGSQRPDHVQLSTWTFEIDMGTWVREGLYLCARGLPRAAFDPDNPAPDAVWAEVAPLDGYGQETMDDVRSRLPAALDWLQRQLEHVPASPDALPRSRAALPGVPSLQWGAELLLAKLAARRAGMSLGAWLGGRTSTPVPVAGLVLRGDAAHTGATTAEPPHVVKLKIGPYAASPQARDASEEDASEEDAVEEDARRIRELVSARADIRIRLDANRNCSRDGLDRLLQRIKDLWHCIDFIEEPLQMPDAPGLALAADETLREACWAGAHLPAARATRQTSLLSRADVWVVKPSLHGGLSDVLDTLDAARRLKRRVVWSSAWETAVGMADLLHVASLWPDEAAGFGTQRLMPHQKVGVCPVALAAAHAPDGVAIRLADQILTFNQWHDRVSHATAELAQRQFSAGDTVAVPAERTIAFCEVLFAAMRLGLCVLPVNTRLPESAQKELVAKAGAVRVDTLAPYRPDENASARARTGAGKRHHVVAGGAVLVATSGSTGTPTTVTLDWPRMLAHARLVNERVQFAAESAWAWSLPPWHVGGLSIPVRCAVAGAALISGGALISEDREGATHASMVPTQLHRLLREKRFSAARMACILLGGGRIPIELLRRAVDAGLRVRTTWGMTEAGSMISCSEVWTRGSGSVVHAGVPLPGIRVSAVDESGRAADVEGGAGKRLMVHSPWAARAHEHIATSDAGYVDAEGRIVVEGRLDRVIISGGENIDPAVIEQALLALPGVEFARVVGIPHEEFGRRPVAFIRTAAAREEGRAEELRHRLRATLPGYMIPDAIYHEPVLPEGAVKWSEQELIAWAEQRA